MVKKMFVRLLLAVNIIVIAGMLLTGYASVVSPCTLPILSILGYGFPIFAFANAVMIMVWVCVRLRMVIVPFVGFVACYSPMMTYCPVNMSRDIPDDCLKVMSYNTWLFGESFENPCETPREERREIVLNYIAESDCDIVCLQEAELQGGRLKDINRIIRPIMPYIDACYGPGGTCVLLFSKHPIKRHELIEFKSAGNLSAAFFVEIDGREIIVINNHLETNHFSTEEKEQFHSMVKGDMERHDMKSESRFILRKLSEAAVLRAPQADAVAEYISSHHGTPMIVCGDFNDIPLSYTHRTISKGLTDCHTACATGPGFSYRKNGMYVRIDNIMCSEEFTPYSCHIDKTIDVSDHFPIISYIK